MIQVLSQLEFYSGSVCGLKQNNVEHNISWNIVARALTQQQRCACFGYVWLMITKLSTFTFFEAFIVLSFVNHVPIADENWIVIEWKTNLKQIRTRN